MCSPVTKRPAQAEFRRGTRNLRSKNPVIPTNKSSAKRMILRSGGTCCLLAGCTTAYGP